MAWEIAYDAKALKDLHKLDPAVQREILDSWISASLLPRIRATSASLYGRANSACGDIGSAITASFASFRTNDWSCSLLRLAIGVRSTRTDAPSLNRLERQRSAVLVEIVNLGDFRIGSITAF